MGSCAEIGGLTDGRVRQVVRLASRHLEVVRILASFGEPNGGRKIDFFWDIFGISPVILGEVSHSEHKTDAVLLTEFAGRASSTAFQSLLERHGPMVHSVAMRILSNHHDAPDVTQTVFLALAREAGKLAKKPSVGGWLHTVSRRCLL